MSTWLFKLANFLTTGPVDPTNCLTLVGPVDLAGGPHGWLAGPMGGSMAFWWVPWADLATGQPGLTSGSHGWADEQVPRHAGWRAGPVGWQVGPAGLTSGSHSWQAGPGTCRLTGGSRRLTGGRVLQADRRVPLGWRAGPAPDWQNTLQYMHRPGFEPATSPYAVGLLTTKVKQLLCWKATLVPFK
jgi:hypothetical protein